MKANFVKESEKDPRFSFGSTPGILDNFVAIAGTFLNPLSKIKCKAASDTIKNFCDYCRQITELIA